MTSAAAPPDPTGQRLAAVLVEDDGGDAKALVRAARTSGLIGPILRARKGEDAFDRLRATAEQAARAAVIPLDARMPRLDGLEVLRAPWPDPHLHDAGVVVPSASTRDAAGAACHDLGAAGHIRKGITGPTFTRAIEPPDVAPRIVDIPKLPFVENL